MRQVGMQIGAERRLGTATFESVDPYTGEPWAILPEATKADVDDAVRAARAAFDGEWTAMTGAARGRLIRRLGELITEHANDLADRYLAAGARFVLVGADVTLLAAGSEELAARHRPAQD